jgi:hypothetical protein
LLGVSAPSEDIRLEGAENIRIHAPSDREERAWCDRCGTTLYFHPTADGLGPKTYAIALGAFDETDGTLLISEIYVDRKPDGFGVAGDHERKTKADSEAVLAGGVGS